MPLIDKKQQIIYVNNPTEIPLTQWPLVTVNDTRPMYRNIHSTNARYVTIYSLDELFQRYQVDHFQIKPIAEFDSEIKEIEYNHFIGPEGFEYKSKSNRFIGISVLTKELKRYLAHHSKQKIKDHTDQGFPSIGTMAAHWGIPATTYSSRINQGWSIERALTTPYKARSFKVTGPNGDTYGTLYELCEAYNIAYNTYLQRRRNGMSLEEALTKPVAETHHTRRVFDHKGQAFKTVAEMAAYHNVSYPVFLSRQTAGWPLEKILTTPTTKKHKPASDHLGNTYESLAKMAEAYDLDDYILKSRLNHNWDLKRALLTPVGKGNSKSVTLKDGTVFPSRQAFATFYKIPYSTVQAYIRHGLTPDEILEKYSHPIVDHLGQPFKSLNQMLTHYGIRNQRYHTLVNKGWSLEKILTSSKK